MRTLLRILMLLMFSLTLALAGCAMTPKIQLSASDMAMEVKSKVPFCPVDYSPDGNSVVTERGRWDREALGSDRRQGGDEI